MSNEKNDIATQRAVQFFNNGVLFDGDIEMSNGEKRPAKIELGKNTASGFIVWFRYINKNSKKEFSKQETINLKDMLTGKIPESNTGGIRSMSTKGTSQLQGKIVQWYIADGNCMTTTTPHINDIYYIIAEDCSGLRGGKRIEYYRIRAMQNNYCIVSLTMSDKGLFRELCNLIFGNDVK